MSGAEEHASGEFVEMEAEALPTARAASVVGLLGVGSLPGLLFCGLGALLAVGALALAPSARRQVEASGGRLGGLALIRTARICSIVALLIAAVFTVGLVAVLTWVADRQSERGS